MLIFILIPKFFLFIWQFLIKKMREKLAENNKKIESCRFFNDLVMKLGRIGVHGLHLMRKIWHGCFESSSCLETYRGGEKKILIWFCYLGHFLYFLLFNCFFFGSKGVYYIGRKWVKKSSFIGKKTRAPIFHLPQW
jgi:hypothetical protein